MKRELKRKLEPRQFLYPLSFFCEVWEWGRVYLLFSR